MAIDLFPHNQKAYESARTLLKETKKAAVIHPTGTGKSFIAFKLCEDVFPGSVCWLSPSEYIFKTQRENLTAAGGKLPENITFLTYAKLSLLSEEEILSLKPAYIVLDEFHRAGAKVWGQGVERLLTAYSESPVLGLSATNIRYLDNQRDMADELFAGNVASEMTLGDAIVEGILPAPTYIVSLWWQQENYRRLQSRISRAKSEAVRDEAAKILEKLRRALENAEGLEQVFAKHIKDKAGKYLVFCANLTHLNKMKSHVKDWFKYVDPEPHVYTAYADDPATDKEFYSFKQDTSDHLKLLFCIDMLNEGVHVADVAGVILFRPTVSPIIYKQQIGRALSASGNKEPVIFDIVNNVENLCSIDSLREEMEVALLSHKESSREGESICEHFKLIDEVREARKLFTNLNQVLTASWDLMYASAKAYYEQHGNLIVPRLYKTKEGYSLGTWLATQRKVHAGLQYGQLDENRTKKLEAIGMVWGGSRDYVWKKMLAAAKKYVVARGNFSIKADYVTPEGLKLGPWVCSLRTKRKGGYAYRLTEEQIAALDELGMIWDVSETVWEEHYAVCAEYYRQHGNLEIPHDYETPKGLKIGLWLYNQRMARLNKGKNRRLTPEQIGRLDAIGIRWDNKYEMAWEESYQEAAAYHAKYHNLAVPVAYVTPAGIKLGRWIARQRDKGKRDLTPYRREKLSAIGMIWEKPDPWEMRYKLAAEFYQVHGNLKVPADYKAQGVRLNKWVSEMRQIYIGNRRGKALSPEQIRRLEAIGMNWGKRD